MLENLMLILFPCNVHGDVFVIMWFFYFFLFLEIDEYLYHLTHYILKCLYIKVGFYRVTIYCLSPAPLSEFEGGRQWPHSAPLWFPAGFWLWGRWLWCRKPLLTEFVEQRRPGLQLSEWMGTPLQETGRHVWRRRGGWWYAVNVPKNKQYVKVDARRAAWMLVWSTHGLISECIPGKLLSDHQ